MKTVGDDRWPTETITPRIQSAMIGCAFSEVNLLATSMVAKWSEWLHCEVSKDRKAAF